MADFHQPRFVPTLHALGTRRIRTDEVAAKARARGRSVTLVLPALAAEVDGPAFPRILRLLERTSLIDRLIVVLGPGTGAQERRAETLVARVNTQVSLVRLGEPAVQCIEERVAAAGFECASTGKGHACWVGMCVALAGEGSDVIAMHDCDILTYHPSLLTRLVAPLIVPETPFDFAKGYYARVTSTLHGRVTRLLVTPLIRALQNVDVRSTLPAFVADFRYPLAGEVALSRGLAESLPMHGGWGLEIGTLGEVYRRQRVFRACQVDIADTYDHRHRPIGTGTAGDVTRMTDEVLVTLIRMLRREHVACDPQTIRYVLAQYRAEVARCLDSYAADAAINGLEYDVDGEAGIASIFGAAIERCLANGLCADLPVLPSWQQLQQHAPHVCRAFAELGEQSDVARDFGEPADDYSDWSPAAAS